jgi:Resolvase, N terminal domain
LESSLRALETFRAQGIEFVSFSEQLDTSTPAGKMVFTVLGAVAELERGLIVERVKAGLRNARAKDKTLGRPRKVLDTKRIAALRAQGVGWKKIAAELGVGVGTIHHSQNNTAPLLGDSKTPEKVFEPNGRLCGTRTCPIRLSSLSLLNHKDYKRSQHFRTTRAWKTSNDGCKYGTS